MDANKALTKNEQSLLLFFETCAVDSSGKVRTKHMNESDCAIARRWDEAGFVKYGKIAFGDIKNDFTHWCELSNDAWECASQLRKTRAIRGIESASYTRLTCNEKESDNRKPFNTDTK